MIPTFSIPKINKTYPRNNFLNNPLYLQHKNKDSIVRAMPYGLTFFKSFVNVASLNADYSVGSGIATYTSVSGTPTLDANGYTVTIANVDVLKYATAGNRTAVQETIAIKFQVSSLIAATRRTLDSTNTKNRFFSILNGFNILEIFPNFDDSVAVKVAVGTYIPAINTSVVAATVLQHSSPYATLYRDGTSVATYTTGDWITPAWGTYFFLGCANNNLQQINGIIQSITIFNRALNADEVVAVSNLI